MSDEHPQPVLNAQNEAHICSGFNDVYYSLPTLHQSTATFLCFVTFQIITLGVFEVILVVRGITSHHVYTFETVSLIFDVLDDANDS